MIEDETLEDPKQLLAYTRGDNKMIKVRKSEDNSITPLKKFTPEEIKEMRKKNKFTQSYFGAMLGVSLKAVQAWEAGTNTPSGAVARLLQILEQDSNVLKKYILV